MSSAVKSHVEKHDLCYSKMLKKAEKTAHAHIDPVEPRVRIQQLVFKACFSKNAIIECFYVRHGCSQNETATV